MLLSRKKIAKETESDRITQSETVIQQKNTRFSNVTIREEPKGKLDRQRAFACVHACARVCVREKVRENERERERETGRHRDVLAANANIS